MAYNNLGILLIQRKDFAGGCGVFKLCDTEKSRSYLLRCFYHLNEKALFEEHLDELMTQEDCNAVVGSFVCRAVQKFGITKPDLFCQDPISYVVSTDLQSFVTLRIYLLIR